MIIDASQEFTFTFPVIVMYETFTESNIKYAPTLFTYELLKTILYVKITMQWAHFGMHLL